jgi:hypothetical protein
MLQRKMKSRFFAIRRQNNDRSTGSGSPIQSDAAAGSILAWRAPDK